MQIEVTVLVGLACSVLSASISYIVFQRNAKKEASAEGKDSGIILTQLGYISSSLDDIKSEQKSLSRQYTELVTDVATSKRDLKTAFAHIDAMREDIRSLQKMK